MVSIFIGVRVHEVLVQFMTHLSSKFPSLKLLVLEDATARLVDATHATCST